MLDDQYEIIRPIGQGGMGCVLEVLRIEDGQRLALKYCAGRELARKRLDREARILGTLRHPHLLPVLGANLRHDPPYFVMPLAVDSLKDELPRRAGELAWALGVLAQICQGVMALHRAGVVHRDLKPANILRLELDRRVVADLGTAKREPRDSTILTRTCSVLGTLGYLAPEQLMPGGSRQADVRTDVFQLGKILYQLVSGRSPAVVEPDLLPRGVAHIVRRATAPRPDDRYRDVDSLLEAIELCQQLADDPAVNRSVTLRQIVRELKRQTAPESKHDDVDAVLDVLGGLEHLRNDEVLEAFDQVPADVLALLGRSDDDRFFHLLRVYCRALESACSRRGFRYADLVALRMKTILAAGPSPRVVALAVEAHLIVAVALNRYSAMAELRQALYQVRDAESALAVAEMLRERRDEFQEIARYLRHDRLHPLLGTVLDGLDWIQTVSF